MYNKPGKGEYLDILLRSPQTVFSTKDAALLWREENDVIIKNRLNKYVQTGKLLPLRRGFYAKDINYDRLEFATRIYTPSYISFETVLTRSGVNFQYYGNIFVASYITRDIVAGDNRISFVRMKKYVLTNTQGVDRSGLYPMATKERAFLDRLYVTKRYHFDNLSVLDWDNVFELVPIYNNKSMIKKVHSYFEDYKSTTV